jgi:hypothetical protein
MLEEASTSMEFKSDIEEAKEDEKNYIDYTIDVEKVRISWNYSGEYAVENISNYEKNTILKAYAIYESNFTNDSIYTILIKEWKKNDEQYVYYGKDMTKDDIIKEWIDNGADLAREELEEYFGDGSIEKTSLGYIEFRNI